MGRPRVENQKKKVVQVNIRLTEEEHKKVTQYSQASGLSPANWMRRKAFTGKFPLVKLSPLDASIYRELKSMGVNLNQIAHKINQGEEYRAHAKFIMDLWLTINKILNRLINDRQSG